MDTWEQISRLARTAPTPHNTQPFRLRPVGADAADLVLVCARLLPVEDRGNRYVYSAIGIFAEALELAARALGRTAHVALGADPGVLPLDGPDTVVARVTLGPAEGGDEAAREALRTLLTARRTSRLPYHPRPVPAEIQRSLQDLAAAAGHRLLVESDPVEVASLLRQNAVAIIDNLQIEDDRREIERWVRYGPTPPHGDGLWQVPLHQPAWELTLGFRAPCLFRVPGLSHLAIDRYLRTQAGTQHVALLSGPFRAWPDLFAAGRLLFRLWVELAKHDLYLHPYGSTLTNPHHARIIGEAFGDAEGWLIFRFGYSDVPPPSPRLETLVIP